MSNTNAGSVSPRRTALGNAASVLRPRASRIFSDIDEPLAGDSLAGTNGEALAVFGSPLNSRAASPIPSKHPSRTNSSNTLDQTRLSPGRSSHAHGNDVAASLSDLWGKSWSSLQGIASNVLGSDASGEPFKDKSPERKRRPFEATHSRATTKKQWGPQVNDMLQPGAGSTEERAALVRAKKRQELLMSNGQEQLDATSRFKRRTSDDFGSSSAPPGEYEDREALVYLHHVKKEDTMAGISIKYNCQLAAIKKANRLWSQDDVQARAHLIIPIDHCGIRGRRVHPNDAGRPRQELLSDGGKNDDAAQTTPTQSSVNARAFSALELPSVTLSPSLQAARSQEMLATSPKSQAEDQPWTHDSWVILEGHSSATEIVRLPRRDLGFFPRTRRRSLSYSDFNESRLPSLDLSPPSIAVSEASSPPANGGRGARPSSSSEHPKHRRSSSTQKFAQQMIGPGGVGTLGGQGRSAPGPAEDRLNKVIAKHLPGIAPSPAAYASDDLGVSGSSSSHAHGQATPALSRNIENVGAAIEGWMRKLARSAAKAVEQVPASTATSAQKSKAVGLSGGSSADLIELSDAFDVGEDEDEGANDRGRRPVLGPPLLANESTSTIAHGSGSGSSMLIESSSSRTSRQRTVRDRPLSRSPLFGAIDSKKKGE